MFKLIYLNIRFYLIIFLFIIISYMVIKYFWNRRYWYYYSWKMDGPFNWPFIGYGWKFLGNNQDIYKVFERFGKLYKTPAAVWMGPKLYIVLTNPKHYEIILNNNNTLSKFDLYEFISEVIGNGLLTAPAHKWKKHRKLIQPTFNQKILNSYVEIFYMESKNLVEDLSDFVGKGFFDIFPQIDKLTTSLIFRTAMGNTQLTKKQISDINEWISSALDIIYDRGTKVWYHPKIIWNLTWKSKMLNEYVYKANNFIKELIILKKQEYRLRITKSNTDDYYNGEEKSKLMGFLDYIIKISEETGQLTDEEILEEMKILAPSGTDTTATTNCFFFLMIGLYTDIQNKICDELHSIFGDSNRQVELDDLNKMVYLERVIKETMRMCPTVPFIGRKLDEDIQLESHVLPKDSSCILLISQTHHDPDIWKNPLKFDPDRFLPEEVAKRHPYAFIPFSAGPRNCIGFMYGMMAMKVILSTIIRTYKVKTSYKNITDIKFTQAILLRCVDGFNVALEYRK